MAKKIRGKNIDKKILEIIEDMMKLGYKLSPISRSTIQRRLGLKSRGTLVGKRGLLIDQARIQQLYEAGLTPDKKTRRSTQDEQIAGLKNRILELEKVRDNLVEKLSMIINGLQAKGYDVEKLMLPLRPNYKKS